MGDSEANLPGGLLDWVAREGKGEITRLERHVARREAWIVDVTATGGEVLEGFLRIDRNPQEGAHVSLRREARICAASAASGVQSDSTTHVMCDADGAPQ